MIQASDSFIEILGFPAKPQRPTETLCVMRESRLLAPELLEFAPSNFMSSNIELFIALDECWLPLGLLCVLEPNAGTE